MPVRRQRRSHEGICGAKHISERHRHRYEFNNDYIEDFDRAGVKVGGVNPERNLVEVIEIPQNDFFIGVQFHPKFKSRPQKAHPLFREFIRAVHNYGGKRRAEV